MISIVDLNKWTQQIISRIDFNRWSTLNTWSKQMISTADLNRWTQLIGWQIGWSNDFSSLPTTAPFPSNSLSHDVWFYRSFCNGVVHCAADQINEAMTRHVRTHIQETNNHFLFRKLKSSIPFAQVWGSCFQCWHTHISFLRFTVSLLCD